MKVLQVKLKYSLVNKVSDIYAIKTGKIYQDKETNLCYQASEWFSFLYRIYTDFLLVIILNLVLFVYLEDYFNNLYLSVTITILMHIIFEIFLILIMPINKINCWEKSLQEKK